MPLSGICASEVNNGCFVKPNETYTETVVIQSGTASDHRRCCEMAGGCNAHTVPLGGV